MRESVLPETRPRQRAAKPRIITFRASPALVERLPTRARSRWIRDAITAALDGRALLLAEDRDYLIELSALLRATDVNLHQLVRAIETGRYHRAPLPSVEDVRATVEANASVLSVVRDLLGQWERGL